MRARTTAVSLAAGVATIVSATACTSSDSGSPGTAATTQSSAPAAAGTSSGPLDPSSHATSSAPASAGSSAPLSSAPASARTRAASPTAKDYLLQPSDLGSGYKTTTQVDATIRPLCKGVSPADKLKPYKSTAQIGFFDAARRVLVTEKITTYGAEIEASQIHSMLLTFDCASSATYNGQRATYSEPRDLDSAAMSKIDSGAAVDVSTARAKVVFASERAGTQVAQLTIVSMGTTAPSKALIDLVTAKAAQRLG